MTVNKYTAVTTQQKWAI